MGICITIFGDTNRSGGPPPELIADIGEDVWTANLPDDQSGVVILGTPLGTPEFVRQHASKRMETEDKMLAELPKFSCPQAAWALLLWSAVPRCNHTIREVPPSLSWGLR